MRVIKIVSGYSHTSDANLTPGGMWAWEKTWNSQDKENIDWTIRICVVYVTGMNDI